MRAGFSSRKERETFAQNKNARGCAGGMFLTSNPVIPDQYFRRTPITLPCSATDFAATMIGFMAVFEG